MSYADVNVGVVYVDVVPPVPSDTSDHVDPFVIDTCHWNVISPGSASDVVAATPNDDVPPTAPVIFTGCDVMFIVLCTNSLTALLITSLAPSAFSLHR